MANLFEGGAVCRDATSLLQGRQFNPELELLTFCKLFPVLLVYLNPENLQLSKKNKKHYIPKEATLNYPSV